MTQSWVEKLGQAGYRLTTDLATQVRAAMQTRPCAGCFLSGPAGAGKTFLAEAVGQVESRRTFFFQAFPGCRKEELFQTILPDASQPSGFRTVHGVLPQAAEASHEGPTLLILDEWDKTHPSTDAFLLDFLQNGRITVPGSEVLANLANLAVFVTLNDEREISEPLLRRLPLVELKAHHPALVEQALRDTHSDHSYIPAVVTLYRRSLLVDLTKPVTIQEMRQLLDSISLLGPNADWNRLVFQFITKNWDDHELLKNAEQLPLPQNGMVETEHAALDPQQYGAEAYAGMEGAAVPEMPVIQRDWLERFPERPLEMPSDGLYGVLPHTQGGYDGVARALLSRVPREEPSADPADLRIAQVGKGEIYVFEALNLERPEEWSLILQNGGELLLEARHGGEVSAEMIASFKAADPARGSAEGETCRIYALSNEEILLRYKALRIRWTPELLEVVTTSNEDTRALWEHLYGSRGVLQAARLAEEKMREPAMERAPEAPSNEQLRDDYLFVLRDYRHLAKWFALLINRNLKVWGRVTCDFRNLTVIGSVLPAADFRPEQEAPESKEEAESIAIFNELTRAALDYFDSSQAHLEAELHTFVARNGEFPPAVEDGGIFGLHEVPLDLTQVKREGLKLYMRKRVQEA